MGDMGEFYNDLREHRRDLRNRFGRECPRCAEVRPNANASILLPGQTCRVDGYRDQRPPLTRAQKYGRAERAGKVATAEYDASDPLDIPF